MHGGEVKVDSEVGKGTTFTVELPIKRSTKPKPNAAPYNPPAGDEKASSELTFPTGGPQGGAPQGTDTPTLLLVDDNEEILYLLRTELYESYSILTASNGQEALELVRQNEISLVVSDVMMPEMDGYELSRQLKSDVETSHIMVILLTAKSAEEARLEGYRCGADDYLTKPFSMEMLRLRIQHLLELQRRRFETFNAGEEVKAEEVTTNPLDQEFLEKAVQCAEQHLDDTSYDVEQLSADLCMSRATFYRKITAITGQKPTEFVRIIRLKRAAQLLRERRHTIAEIVDLVGFSSPSYFNRRFKELYGVQPSQYK